MICAPSDDVSDQIYILACIN